VANLRHHDPFVRAEAALALGWMGPLAENAVSELVQLIEAYRPRAQVRAQPAYPADASGAVTPPAPPSTVPQSSEETARANAIQALGRIGPGAGAALGLLREIASREEDPTRTAAELAIAQIES
jgi:HEAT repeat protein